MAVNCTAEVSDPAVSSLQAISVSAFRLLPVKTAATVSYVDPTVLILTTPVWLGVKAYQTVLWTGTLHDGIGSPPAVSTVDSRTDWVRGL